MSLAGMGFDSKRDFAPPTVLLGLLLCPWTWGISSKSLQHHAATAPVSIILLGLLCPVSYHQCGPNKSVNSYGSYLKNKIVVWDCSED